MSSKRSSKATKHSESKQPQFHITIGTAPEIAPFASLQQERVVSINHELRLVKAALLYADRATLCSLTTSLLVSLLAIGSLTTRQKAELITTLIPVLAKDTVDEEVLATMRLLMQGMDNKQRLSLEHQRVLSRIENKIEEAWQPAQEYIVKYANDIGIDGLLQAVQSGILHIHVLGQTPSRGKSLMSVTSSSPNKNLDKTLIEFIDFISRAIVGRRTYPLFDDVTGNIIRQAINEKKLTVSDTGVARGKHSLLAGSLLERLPLFDEATIEEILDIRKELEDPLIRFRQGIIGFSEQMKQSPWSQDFPAEADQLFHKSIAPAVIDIEESVKSTRSLAAFFERLAKKPVVPGGVLSAVLSQATALPQLASLAMIGGGLASAALTTVVEYRELVKERKNVEQNQLYFYYRAGEILKS